MPNHCSGTLTIESLESTSKESVLRLKTFAMFARETVNGDLCELSANRFIPYPKKFTNMDEAASKDSTLKDGFNSGGYGWCNQNWGTKWGFYDVSLDQDMDKDDICDLVYNFQTAWSPALPVVEKMSKAFPDLKFVYEYDETGCDFWGEATYINGECVSHEQGDSKELAQWKKDNPEDFE